MKGTERQVAWAEKIRADYHIGVARLRALRKRVPEEFTPEIDERLRKLVALEERLGDDAVAWIEKGRSSTAYAIGSEPKWRDMWAPLLKGKVSKEFTSWLFMSLDWETPVAPVFVDASRRGIPGVYRCREWSSDAVEGELPYHSPNRLLSSVTTSAGFARKQGDSPTVAILPDDVAEDGAIRKAFEEDGVKIIAASLLRK